MSKSKEQPDMRILKKATCKTLSGKSTLTYHVGASPDDETHVRIHANDGGGMFSREWISFEAIQAALENDGEGAAITSVRLIPLFKGKSVNTPSFLLAALKHLKLVRPMQGKTRHHERLDPGPFLDQVEKLMSSTAAGKTKGTAKKAPVKKAVRKTTATSTKKAAIKKKAMSRKKTSRTV
ncbi:MAG: hypothetical protein ABFS45_18995 [Pseudomonadota bacterium]